MEFWPFECNRVKGNYHSVCCYISTKVNLHGNGDLAFMLPEIQVGSCMLTLNEGMYSKYYSERLI